PLPLAILFPYTTLFRSAVNVRLANAVSDASLLITSTISVAACRASYGVAFPCIKAPPSPHVLYSEREREYSPALPTSNPYVLVRSEEHTSELQSRENLV